LIEEGTYFEGPYTRLDLCVFTVLDGALHVLLAKRTNAPFRGLWALPGGALKFQIDRSLEQGFARVVRERLRCPVHQAKQQCALGGYDRYERGKWCLSIVYRTLVRPEHFAPTHGKRISDFEWRAVDEAVADPTLASDHMQLIAQCVGSLRQEVKRLELPASYLPLTFTLTQLQTECEQLLGKSVDKSSFRRRLAERHMVEPTGEVQQLAAHRPAKLYRIRAAA
jgi:8-oxo-dGTP diphosphatase